MTGEVKIFGAKVNGSKGPRKNRSNRPKGSRTLRPTLELEVEPSAEADPPAQSRLSGKNFRPTPSQRVMVAGLAAFGIRSDGIATYIRISDQALRRYFREELETGFDKTEAALAAVLLVKALGGNMPALSLLLKCKMDWKENTKATDGPATIEALSTEQRITLIENLRKSLPPKEARARAPRKNKALVESTTWSSDPSN